MTDKKQGRDEWWQKSVWMDKKAFKEGDTLLVFLLSFHDIREPFVWKGYSPKRSLLPCWNVTVVRGIFAQSMWCKENVHICACSRPRGDFNGREEWPLNVIGFSLSGRAQFATHLCEPSISTMHFIHRILHRYRKDFFNFVRLPFFIPLF